MSVYLQLMQERRILSANYITMIHPTPHPDRVMGEHDFLYMLDGTWEIGEELPAAASRPGEVRPGYLPAPVGRSSDPSRREASFRPLPLLPP